VSIYFGVATPQMPSDVQKQERGTIISLTIRKARKFRRMEGLITPLLHMEAIIQRVRATITFRTIRKARKLHTAQFLPTARRECVPTCT